MDKIRTTRRGVLQGGLAAAGFASMGTLAFGQTAGAWDEVVKKAREQKRVNVYNVSPPDQGQRLADAFKKKYPFMEIVTTRGAGDLPPRLDAERQAGVDGGDVFLHSDVLWFTRNAEHLIDVQSPALAAWPDIPSAWQVKGKAPNISFPPFSILVWNTDHVKEDLKDWKDILKPQYKGHIGTREDMTPSFLGYLDFFETELGADYLVQLGQQKPKFYTSVVPLTQAVAAGEVWIGNISVPSVIKDLIAQGAPIKASYPKPGFAIPWSVAALKNSKRPEAARLFVDFVMSPEGQTALNGDGNAASPLKGIQGAYDISDFKVLQPEKFTQKVRDDWKVKFDKMFR